MRIWFITHIVLNSDSAVVGLMARQILHGKTYAFYWGQSYGGGETYVVAAMFRIFGQSAVSLALTTTILAAASSVVAWRVALRLVSDPYLAVLAGALVWSAPEVGLLSTSSEYGFRGVTLLTGLAMLLFALRLLDDNRRRYVDICGLGLVLGIGWWSSPEIAYYVVPAALIVIGAVVLDSRDIVADSSASFWFRRWIPRFGTLVVATSLGALPWLWVNIPDGFLSIRPSSFGGTNAIQNPGYVGRLSLAFHHAFPVELGFQRYGTGSRTFGSPVSELLEGIAVIVMAIAVVLALTRVGRAQAVGIAVIAFPFMYALSPATWFWESGRYAVFLPSLLALVLAIGCEQLAPVSGSLCSLRWRFRNSQPEPLYGGAYDSVARVSVARDGHCKAGRLAMSVILMVSVTVTIAVFVIQASGQAGGSPNLSSFWVGHPNSGTELAISDLEDAGIRYAYADYWMAYKVDFLAGGRLVVSPAAHYDVVRSISDLAAVRRRPDAAWLFIPPSRLAAGLEQFPGSSTAPVGPFGTKQESFQRFLVERGIPYRIVHAGVINAVVPGRRVTPRQVVASGVDG